MRGRYAEAYCPCLKATYSTTKTVTEPTQDPIEHEQPPTIAPKGTTVVLSNA
jgi:hypothetical protein